MTARIASCAAACLVLTGSLPAHAACPVELAIYGEAQSGASIEFRPNDGAVVVANKFRMLLEGDLVLDGFVMWSEGVARPYATLTYKCPEGDVTGAEIEACTLWQGVVYVVAKDGTVGLLPAEKNPAPDALLLPDLGPALATATVFAAPLARVPWDVFEMKGCQE